MARRTGQGGHDRKAAQLAAQIARSVEATLLGEVVDDVLNNISVDRVEPAPGSRMNVMLVVHEPGASLPKQDVLDRLESHRGLIVQHMARDLSRRALPQLSFWIVRDPGAAAPTADRDADEPDPPSALDG